MARPPFPKTLRQFQSDFATEEACQQYLAACRWTDGFTCPRCGHRRAYELVNQPGRQCVCSRRQVSLTAGTVLHRTKIPLTHWFSAAYMMTTDKRGVSAVLVQRQLGLSCYETAWMMLHKLRRAMVNVARERLIRLGLLRKSRQGLAQTRVLRRTHPTVHGTAPQGWKTVVALMMSHSSVAAPLQGLVAFAFFASLWVSEWGTSWIWERLVPVLPSLALAIGGAGRWRMDSFLARRRPNSLLW